MNAGKILIHGSAGDAAGYAMRGGKIYVRDHAGYRAGIHMKEYKKKVPNNDYRRNAPAVFWGNIRPEGF